MIKLILLTSDKAYQNLYSLRSENISFESGKYTKVFDLETLNFYFVEFLSMSSVSITTV
jgi:hypothetical protein